MPCLPKALVFGCTFGTRGRKEASWRNDRIGEIFWMTWVDASLIQYSHVFHMSQVRRDDLVVLKRSDFMTGYLLGKFDTE